MQVRDAVAVVTGGGSGLGLAVVRDLAAAGAQVVAIDLPSQRAAVEALDGVHFAAADVTVEGELAAAVDGAADLGPIRVLVTCAGVAPAARLLGRDGPMPLAAFDRVVRVNLLGTVDAIRLAAERMSSTDPIDGERGVVITTSSVAATDGQIGQTAYAASKAGVAALSLPLARELGPAGIRVVSIAPGVFDTPMVDRMPAAVRSALEAQVPNPPRLGNPAEFAALVRHVIGNRYLNGETIRLDGGIRMAAR